VSALTDRIAEVLVSHLMYPDGRSGYAVCTCGLAMLTVTEHTAHVAEQIEAALGLTEEKQHRLG